MYFLELLYYGAVLGIGCYLGAMGMKAMIDLIVGVIDGINKKLSKSRSNNFRDK